jgi:hypothetical protein
MNRRHNFISMYNQKPATCFDQFCSSSGGNYVYENCCWVVDGLFSLKYSTDIQHDVKIKDFYWLKFVQPDTEEEMRKY